MDETAFSERTRLYRIPVSTPFQVGSVNMFLLKRDPVTLIDAGMRTDEAYEVLVEALRGHGLVLGDIRRVFLTHQHIDHTGLLRRIMDETSAESWGHPAMQAPARQSHSEDDKQRDFYVGVMAEFGVPEETATQSMRLWGAFRDLSDPFVVNHALEDGGGCGPFRTYFVPGHSATDTLFVHEEDGYTIVGDHILKTMNPNPLLRRPQGGAARPHSLVEYQDSLGRSRALELGVCLPGHGAPFEDHRAVIDGILRQHERKNGRVLRAIGPSGATVYEIARSLYPSIEIEHLYLALSIATGHLELLESQGILRREMRTGAAHYAKAAPEAQEQS